MNTVQAGNAEVYTSNIYVYADEYESSLKDTEELYKQNSSQFTGMIKYINRNMGFYKNKSMYGDIDLLNDIWEIYTDLVYKYNQKPTIEEYALLIGISRDTLYTWMRGEHRKDDYCEKLSLFRSDTVKKWQEECKLGRYKGAAAGNVGYIFLCKAVDGMAETAPVQADTQPMAQEVEELPILGQTKPVELCDNQTQLEADNQ